MKLRTNSFRRCLLFTVAFLAIAFSGSDVVRAESESGNAPVDARLNFQVNMPQMVRLQIGSPGGVIDTVNFIVTAPWPLQTSVPGDIQPFVSVRGKVSSGHSVVLTADSSNPLRDNISGLTISFTHVSYQGTGNFSGVSGIFNGTASQQIFQMNGSGIRQGTFRYTYDNTAIVTPGIYAGQVTYTLAVP